MFALAAPGALAELLEGGGFIDVLVESVDLPRESATLDQYIEVQLDLSGIFAGIFRELDEPEQLKVRRRISELASEFTAADGTIRLPGRSLVATASA